MAFEIRYSVDDLLPTLQDGGALVINAPPARHLTIVTISPQFLEKANTLAATGMHAHYTTLASGIFLS